MPANRPPEPCGNETDRVLGALAEPRRRAILELVAHSELSAGEIASCFDVTRTAVSQHLTVLKNAGLLTERRVATRRLYRARPEGLAGLRTSLTRCGRRRWKWRATWSRPNARPTGTVRLLRLADHGHIQTRGASA